VRSYIQVILPRTRPRSDVVHVFSLKQKTAYEMLPLLEFRVCSSDLPSARKVHMVPTPLLGGAAIVVGLGLLDDLWDLPAPVKLRSEERRVGTACCSRLMCHAYEVYVC